MTISLFSVHGNSWLQILLYSYVAFFLLSSRTFALFSCSFFVVCHFCSANDLGGLPLTESPPSEFSWFHFQTNIFNMSFCSTSSSLLEPFHVLLTIYVWWLEESREYHSSSSSLSFCISHAAQTRIFNPVQLATLYFPSVFVPHGSYQPYVLTIRVQQQKVQWYMVYSYAPLQPSGFQGLFCSAYESLAIFQTISSFSCLRLSSLVIVLSLIIFHGSMHRAPISIKFLKAFPSGYQCLILMCKG